MKTKIYVKANKLIYSSLMYYVRITMAYGILRLKIKHHKYTPWSQKTQFLILLFSKLIQKVQEISIMCCLTYSSKIKLYNLLRLLITPSSIQTSYELFSLPFSRYLRLLLQSLIRAQYSLFLTHLQDPNLPHSIG